MAKSVFLFLDIDGVLAPIETHPRLVGADQAPRPIDEACAECLAGVVGNYAEVRIVISSSWRLLLPLDAIRALLPPLLAARVVGATPDVGRPDRLREINAWLSDNGHEGSAFVIVDDSPYLFPAGLVRVSPAGEVGFDASCARALDAELQRLAAGAD